MTVEPETTMAKYVLGIDIGTTSIKAVLLDIHSKTVSESCSVPTRADIVATDGSHTKEQDTGLIIAALNECIASLPRDKLQHVSRIGVSGQMHGVLFWNGKSGCDWSGGNLFKARHASQLITWQDGRCSGDFLAALPTPDSHLSVATGFGCATVLWYTRHRPGFLADFTVAGTVQDYVVSMLCGLEGCVMTPQNAASWGYFNTSTSQWNTDILKSAGFPLRLLPECVASGGMAGRTCSGWHGVPAHTPVGAALGDFQCSVYSCMTDRSDAVLNISTSAQLTHAMPEDFRPPQVPEPASSVSYFPYFDGSYLAVAASLNGGNVMATFVEMLKSWMKELGGDIISDARLYERVIGCALAQGGSSGLRVSPTILGERHSPRRLGQVTNISASTLSLGHVVRATCAGVLDNMAAMMPAEALLGAGVKRILGSGSALARNEVLRQEAERAFPLLPVVHGGRDVDSAVGVAMVVCDRF